MILAAALIVKDERARYLEPCLDHLLTFCDRVVILDDASTDGTYMDLLHRHPDRRVRGFNASKSHFFVHEGQARNTLLHLTLQQNPTHVINVDADELVDSGLELRDRIERAPDVPVWSLAIEECWNADAEHLWVREDSGWRTHPLNVVWKVPDPLPVDFKILDRKLACRRVPVPVWKARAQPSGCSLLHLGWVDKSTRQQRYQRYATHDGGRFHAGSHLRSILWDDSRVTLRPRPWPVGQVFDGLRERFSKAAA